MQRKKRAWAAVTFVATSLGGVIGREHLIGPNPSTYFALGVLAALSAIGVAYGFWEAKRIIRSDKPIGD